mgnify:CR=1 FL=1
MLASSREEVQVNELALFAGAGGGILGGKLLGWRTVCAVEFNAHAASVLVARQNDGHLEPFPIWDDVRTFDGKPWRGIVDVVSGGFPCTDISVAGKGEGIEGEESGLWREMSRVIGEVRPRFAFVENSPALTFRGLGRVLGDLAEMGFDAQWGCVAAEDAIFAGGDPIASHDRERMWIFADSELRRMEVGRRDKNSGPHVLSRRNKEALSQGNAGQDSLGVPANSDGKHGGTRRTRRHSGTGERLSLSERSTEFFPAFNTASCWWQERTAEPMLFGMADGVAHRVDRIRAIGNGQVPAVASLAWSILSGSDAESSTL